MIGMLHGHFVNAVVQFAGGHIAVLPHPRVQLRQLSVRLPLGRVGSWGKTLEMFPNLLQ